MDILFGRQSLREWCSPWLCIAAVALSMAACGGDDTSSSGQTSDTTASGGHGGGTGGTGGIGGMGGNSSTGGQGGAGGSIREHGPGATEFVSAGQRSASASYVMVFTLGQ